MPELRVFNVEHGACALLSDGMGNHAMIDCGHNSSTNWYPGSYCRLAGITDLAALFVTNYDEDHVSGIENLFRNTNVATLFRNMQVSPAAIEKLKTADGMGNGIRFLVQTAKNWMNNGLRSSNDIGLNDCHFTAFANSPVEFDDENNLSMAVSVRAAGVNFLFTGDLEQAGWRALLRSQNFRETLAGIDVFFASHHGRESGCCEEVFNYCKPRFIVISDKAKGYQTQETSSWYFQRAQGGIVNWESNQRRVLTTRRDGSLKFIMNQGTYDVSRI
ncbi:hypothetical protein [Henriciella sp.]|uniref:ComEC/Rec2 family competence protein n=1 Tax=Henriciella sp. TaxID=1968823 RepID=UPI0026221F7B|nr:hypothetical protein [Henriciella sp.]